MPEVPLQRPALRPTLAPMNANTTETSTTLHSNRARGAAHLWSKTLIPTTREAPAEAESPSHIWLVRAGYIRRVGSGIYNYLPLAWRSLQKITQIIREEMNAAGASEMLMPALEPIELFKDTKRDIDYGDLLFKSIDRHGRAAALAPTHEEVITNLIHNTINSYKQLPLSLYQIQTKFRDEFRPRAGLLRCREFIMKDAYSFHLNIEGDGGLNEVYDAMYQAYCNIFARCGLDYSVVEAEAGPIGGSASHEFMVNCDSGEDTILRCPESGYAANVEKCEIGKRSASFEGEPSQELEKIHTPNLPGIDMVAEFLKTQPAAMLKTIVFQTTTDDAEPSWVLAVVRGDHEVNEGKVKDALQGQSITLADEKLAKQAGFTIGYVSPCAIKALGSRLNIRVLVDHDAAQGERAWATGADEKDHHVTGFNWKRELGNLLNDNASITIAEIRNAQAGDPSPRVDGQTLAQSKGIEVGHIFKLGSKYSDAMGLSIADHTQQRQSVVMGCYGIGVSRTLAACVEMSHDDFGIIMPPAIAPYLVLITIMKPDQENQMDAALKLASKLASIGIDVLIDDRKERPGVKFKDGDLVGIPIRLTIGDKALDQNCVEFKKRDEPGKGDLVPINEVAIRCQSILT